MGREIAITLTDEQQAQLEALSSERAQSTAELLQAIVADYLDYESDYRAAVAEAEADVEAGRVYPLGQVAQEMRELVERRIREHKG